MTAFLNSSYVVIMKLTNSEAIFLNKLDHA